jgi:Ni,Fe-hydrogenase III component G
VRLWLVIAAGPVPGVVADRRGRQAREVAAIDPAAAGRTADEVFAFILVSHGAPNRLALPERWRTGDRLIPGP